MIILIETKTGQTRKDLLHCKSLENPVVFIGIIQQQTIEKRTDFDIRQVDFSIDVNCC
jgi:hypothetical protein